MNSLNHHRIFCLVPGSRGAGLTSMALGLVRALQLAGVRAGFMKPVIQREAARGDRDLSCHFARINCGLNPPDPIPYAHAAELVRTGRIASLMEEVVAQAEALRPKHDVIVAEGLIPDADFQIATRLNAGIIRSLSASIVPVLAGGERGAEELAAMAASAGEQNGGGRVAGVMVNHCASAASAKALRGLGMLKLKFGGNEKRAPIIAAIPTSPQLSAPRIVDIAEELGLQILQRGAIDRMRMEATLVAARSPEKFLGHLRPGTLVLTPCDRSDAIIATALMAERGMPLAGLLLTCGKTLAPELASILETPPLDSLPILCTEDDTYTTAARVAKLSGHAGREDTERMEKAISFIAGEVDSQPLVHHLTAPVEALMPPPVFRHRLIEAARAANRRIVLPEGDEPRTVRAAAICAEKGIARCVLLGEPARVHQAAKAQGIELPPGMEILDPEGLRGQYVEPMMELRKHKGLSAHRAGMELEDAVVLGTMMVAMGDADGLVSGAVHTTANTVRPALQLIKTAPESSIVSSVFFMLMPDQVFVYGDCAINPDPNAQQLAEIAMQSADSARAFGLDPRVAMISYSTGASGTGQQVEKVREATKIVRARRPDIVIDGPIQYDAAAVESVGLQKAPKSPLNGHANVFVFPDLNTGNTTYKAVQRAAQVVSVGPMLQGLRKPVNDLSRGALVDDIVFTIALTAIQAGQ